MQPNHSTEFTVPFSSQQIVALRLGFMVCKFINKNEIIQVILLCAEAEVG
jgi:hypothetical protein